MNPLPESSSPPVDARLACADSTNNACAAGASKSDDPGRGGFVIEAGKFYADRSGRKRGPVDSETVSSGRQFIDDDFGFITFFGDGTWIDSETPHNNDLISEWIDWKAVAEVVIEALDKIANHRAGESRSWDVVGEMLDIAEGAIATAASLKGEGGGL